jgi:hypothetical protein
VDRVLGDAGQDVCQPSLRIDLVHFGGLCRAPNYAAVPEDASVVALPPSVARTAATFHSA